MGVVAFVLMGSGGGGANRFSGKRKCVVFWNAALEWCGFFGYNIDGPGS